MARYYVFPDQGSAEACVEAINARARVVYRLQGYRVDTSTGDVIGQRLSDGAPMPDAARTQTWDVPRQRLDGKWVVRHCEAVPGATFVLRPTAVPPLTVADFVGQDVGASVLVEVEGASWWPVPPSVIVGV